MISSLPLSMSKSFQWAKRICSKRFCTVVVTAHAVHKYCAWCTADLSLVKSPQAHRHVVGMLPFTSLTYTNRARPLLLFCSCVCFRLHSPFNCISFHKLSRQLSAFSLYSTGLISAFLVLSTLYLFMKVSFSPDIIPSGWAQNAN